MSNIFSKAGGYAPKFQDSKNYTEATLFPIVDLPTLLPEIEKNHYLSKIQEIVTLPEDYFKVIYEELIENFARFVQCLPEVYGDSLGGLLNDGLRRGLLAIQVLTKNQPTKPHPLFIFAIYSISLLSDIGQILNYHVMISNEHGGFISDWHPLLGYMSEFGEYFKLRPAGEVPHGLIGGITPLFARQLLSETALTWLSSNNQIFDMWLAFLHKEESWASGLVKILKIDPTQLQIPLKEFSAFPVDILTTEPLATDLGEKFLAWLKEGLESGKISVNQTNSLVHVIKTNELDLGVFLAAPELFQQFGQVYAKTRDWIVVCKQLNYLGMTKLSGGDVKFEQFFSEPTDAKTARSLGFHTKERGKSLLSSRLVTTGDNIKEGIVLRDANMLFTKVPGVSTVLRDVEMRWSLDTSLPKIQTKSETQVRPSPESGMKQS